MPREFYDSLANSLGSGVTYKLWFPNYSVYTGNAVLATNKKCNFILNKYKIIRLCYWNIQNSKL
jgi:hypothetical protein